MWHSQIQQWREFLVASGKPINTTVKGMVWQMHRLAETHPRGPHTIRTIDLVAFLTSHGWAPATIRVTGATFRSFFGWRVLVGLAEDNPATALPRVKVGSRSMPAATDTQIRDAHSPDSRVALMIELGAREGLRRSEIAAVHVRDVIQEPDGWSLVVHGKGAKDRVIPLHADMAHALLAHGRGWVFPSERGQTGHLSPSRVGTLISQALPPGITAHALRRRFATKAYAGGHDLKAVSQLLGHANITTTVDCYVKNDSGALREALKFAA